MSKLTEKVVQDTAQAFLYQWYRKRARRGRIFSRTEVRTRRKYGGKRADGLLAFRHFLWGMTVVSMEAKSYKTLAAMKPFRDDNILLLNSLKAGMWICLLSGAFLAFYRMQDGFMQFLLPVNTFVIAALLYGFLTRNSARHKVADVLNQLAEYPANERWLAFSEDSLHDLPRKKRRLLGKICRTHGIGIVVVKRKGNAYAWYKARRERKWFGDFLKYYSNEKKIREAIES